jgi:hypothetical protein
MLSPKALEKFHDWLFKMFTALPSPIDVGAVFGFLVGLCLGFVGGVILGFVLIVQEGAGGRVAVGLFLILLLAGPVLGGLLGALVGCLIFVARRLLGIPSNNDLSNQGANLLDNSPSIGGDQRANQP